MASNSDVREVDKQGKVTNKRRFDSRDFDYIADYVVEEYTRRKKRRSDLEKQWKDIDRQVEMIPDISFKKMPDGSIDPNRNWMAEVELPLQAQALEVLTSDARRFMFPNTGLCFRAHAETTDEYFERVDFQSLVMGDQNEVPSKINQDNADKLVEGFVQHFHKQYDFLTRVDKINAEAFKYGMGVGRGRMETKNVYIDEATGVRKETQRIPVLVPCSIKNLLLDDCEASMHSAQMLGPAHIWCDYMPFANLAMACNVGSKDPDDEDGGWMPKYLGKIEPDKDKYVTLLEMEGDIIVPRKTVESLVIPGAIVTVAMGGKAKNGGTTSTRAVVRFRFRKQPFSSYLLFPYHYESASATYPTSPLMKGRPIQTLASQAANRLMDSAMLKVAPPIGYDRTDMNFAASGGPKVHPFALWGTSDPQVIKAFVEVGGDPSAMAAVLTRAVQLYAELTGVLPARLGAQTVSHTTAFAKDAELQRGAVRTIDYCNAVGNGAMLKWFDMAYQMGRDSIGKDGIAFFIDAYGGWVDVKKDHLPDSATYDWLGAGGPQDQAQLEQARMNSLSVALKMDQLGIAMGLPPTIDLAAAVREVLREGKWTDVDAITKLAPTGGMAIAPEQIGAGPATAAVQNLALPAPGA